MAEEVKWWKLQCPKCRKPCSFIAVRFGFDMHSTFHFYGVCRFCLSPFEVEHTFPEIMDDVEELREKYHIERHKHNGDFKEWESEMKEDDDE